MFSALSIPILLLATQAALTHSPAPLDTPDPCDLFGQSCVPSGVHSPFTVHAVKVMWCEGTTRHSQCFFEDPGQTSLFEAFEDAYDSHYISFCEDNFPYDCTGTIWRRAHWCVDGCDEPSPEYNDYVWVSGNYPVTATAVPRYINDYTGTLWCFPSGSPGCENYAYDCTASPATLPSTCPE